MSFSLAALGAEKYAVSAFRASGCFGVASVECLAWQLMKVLFIAMGEVAPTAEAHLFHNLAHAREALVVALLGVEQQLPHSIQADGALQFERCALEVLFGSFEQGCP